MDKQNLISCLYAILAVFGIGFYGIENLLTSVLVYYFIWVIFTPCWWHLSLWHWGLIKTHKLVHDFHLFMYCAFYPFSPSGPMKVHLRHHDLVNTEADRNTFKVSQGRWKHLFNRTTPPLRNRPTRVQHPNPTFPFWIWCDKHHMKIFYAYQLAFLLLAPKWFIFAQAIPYLIGRAELPVKLHDIAFHYKPEKNFRNHLWMFPVLFTDAFHVDHHDKNITLNFGPWIWKWINPQWWYFIIIDPSIRKHTLNSKNHTFTRIKRII